MNYSSKEFSVVFDRFENRDVSTVISLSIGVNEGIYKGIVFKLFLYVSQGYPMKAPFIYCN